jgi:tripeptide aminopeptidase
LIIPVVITEGERAVDKTNAIVIKVNIMINKERITKEFCELVAIDAIPFKERAMADALTKKLVELGFDVTEDKTCDQYHGTSGNLYGYLQGEMEGDPILLSAHLDTVEPGLNKKAILHKDGTITSDGTTVLGADDLAGVVSILEAVRTAKEKKLPHRSIEVLFTFAEEAYISGSEVFNYSVVKSKEAYVLDLDGAIGTAAIKAPTLVAFTARFIGKAAHAGFAPEQGINAIAIAAEAISKVGQGRIDDETTVNIGMITGGKAKNIVSAECVLQGETRSLKHDKALAQVDQIKQIFEATVGKYHAELDFTTSFGCIAYEIADNHPVIKRFEKACQKIMVPVRLTETFGGSDNNNFVRHGITGIVIACGMHQVHSLNEYTHVEELVACSSIVLNLITEIETD